MVDPQICLLTHVHSLSACVTACLHGRPLSIAAAATTTIIDGGDGRMMEVNDVVVVVVVVVVFGQVRWG